MLTAVTIKTVTVTPLLPSLKMERSCGAKGEAGNTTVAAGADGKVAGMPKDNGDVLMQ